MNIEDFILQRCAAMGNADYYAMIYKAVQWHKNWPVLVEEQPEFIAEPRYDTDSIVMASYQQFTWMTQQEYIKKFNSEPTTAPLLRIWANMFSDHPDFQEEWRV